MTAIEAVSNCGYAQRMRKTPSGPATKQTLRQRRDTVSKRIYPNRIHELTRAKNMTYAELADALGVHETTIARLAIGEQALTHDWMKRLGEALGVRPEELIVNAGVSSLRRIRIKGSLQAGDWAESHEWPEDDQYDVMVPDDPALRTLPLYGGMIVGESMNLRYPNGSAVVLSRIGQRPGEIAVGKRYHVRMTRADGQTEETIKTLVADEQNHFWLKPESSHPEHQEWIPLDGKPDVTVELLGRVRFVVHRED